MIMLKFHMLLLYIYHQTVSKQCFLTLSDQGTFTPVGAQGGGDPRDPTVENHFPSRILQWNLYHICMDYKKSQFWKKKKKKRKILYSFKMAAK